MGSMLKTTVLLGLLSGLLLLIGDIARRPQRAVDRARVSPCAMNFGSYWFSDKIVLSMYRAQEVGPSHPLYQSSQRLVAARGPADAEACTSFRTTSPNAFATGRDPEHAAVAATEGILRLLSEDELAGVMAHELAHVKHRDILISSVAATIGAAIMFLAQWRSTRRSSAAADRTMTARARNPLALLAMMLLAPIAATLIQAAISRSREFGADAGGAQIAGSPVRARQRAAQARSRRPPRSDGRQPGDGAHVHHQAVQRRRPAVALQHPSADRAAASRR